MPVFSVNKSEQETIPSLLLSPQKQLAANLRKTTSDIGRTTSFTELAALILARRYNAAGRKKDARRLLTSYQQNFCPTKTIESALHRFS